MTKLVLSLLFLVSLTSAVSAEGPADADFDGDGVVGFPDFLLFAPAIGSREGEPEYEARFDLNAEAVVDFTDFLMFTTYFGQTVYDPLLTVITPADSQHELVLVPEGAFMMGSDDGEIDEQPVHTVTLSAYYVDKFEVTNAQYAALLNTIGSNVDSEGNDLLNLRNNNAQIEQTDSTFVLKSSDFANRPVIEVTWYGAAEYCEWMGGRLPTEAEWEKAARGTDARAYPWGDTLPTSDLANHNDEAGHTTDVGRYPEGASPYGALDMAGNVWEWVLDWNDIRYYADSPERDPQGPESGTFRVFRGGAWGSVSVCGGGVSRFSLTSPARSAGPSERI